MLSPRDNYRLDPSQTSRLATWGTALAMHVMAGGAVILGWPQARTSLELSPIEVRVLIPEALPKNPPPPSPRRKPPPPPAQNVLSAPLPEPIVPTVVEPPPILTTSAVSATAFFVAPAPSQPGPVQPVTPVHTVAPAPAPEPFVEARYDADYFSNPKPLYPMASRRLGEAGTVFLRVHVTVNGEAGKVELKTSSGFARLDESAMAAVARWHFVPARRGSTQVAAWVVVPIIFALN